MPLSYEIDVEKNLIMITGGPELTRDDVIEHQRRLQNDPRLRLGLYSLVDIRGVTNFKMTGRDVLHLALNRGDFPIFSSKGRTAIVVSSAVVFAMARMYALSRRKDIEPMAIFYEMEEARRWLGLEGDAKPAE